MAGWLLAATLLFGCAWWIYSLFFGAPAQFDDEPNLAALRWVDDARDAIVFITSGQAGITGRPLSLASFLLHGTGWPSDIASMRRVNLLLHLLNGLLLLWIGLLLAHGVMGMSLARSAWAALAGTAFWLIAPLFLSTGLMVVQRMTLLSGTFVLLGVLSYLHGRVASFSGRSGHGRMISGIAVFGALALLSKENGALLPFYLLCVEWLIRAAGPGERHPPPIWMRAGLWLMAGGVLLYLATRLPEFGAAEQARGFSPGERLLTEGRVLWEYLRLALLPVGAALGPFHDDWQVSRGLFSPPATLAALVAWGTVGLLAWRWRARCPLCLFALLWFLSGHLLESTVVPLELYFEHRNYVPLAGPFLLLGMSPWLVSGRMRKVVGAGIGALLLGHAAVAWQTAETWRRPLLAAELWSMHHPQSRRATQYLAGRYEAIGWHGDAFAWLHGRWRKGGERDVVLGLQALALGCATGRPQEGQRALFERLVAPPADAFYGAALSSSIVWFLEREGRNGCSGVGRADLLRLTRVLLEVPAVERMPGVHAELAMVLARDAAGRGALDETLEWAQRAYHRLPRPETVLFMSTVLEQAGQWSLALARLEDGLRDAPRHPVWYWHWRLLLEPHRERLRRKADSLDDEFVPLREQEAEPGAG